MNAEDTSKTSTTDSGSACPRLSEEQLPKLCGADIELGNLILGLDRPSGTGRDASRALLREIDGVSSGYTYTYAYDDYYRRQYPQGHPSYAGRPSHSYSPQDWGRKFLAANGGCVYIDLDHLEICLPEVRSALEWVACFHAMLRIVRDAMEKANAVQPEGRRIQVLVNNSDGFGNAYGSHLDFLITRRAWTNIFERKLHHMLWLAAYQASSIVFTGQGKVGSENGSPPVAFQLSQRADFFETLTGVQTTHNRPLVNSRDEPLCGLSGDCSNRMARLHCIFYDSNLCHTANFLKVGVMQIILAMLECELVDSALLLDDPVEAVKTFSRDHTLGATARLASGESTTAVDLQMRFLDAASGFVDRGGCEGVVPHADRIISRWADTLCRLKNRELSALAPHLDWVLKLCILEAAMDRHPELDWHSPEIKILDHLYSSLDPNEGLYWTYESLGAVERLVADELIERRTKEPPAATRAYTRAMLLRKAGSSAIDSVDWDSIRFRISSDGRWWYTYRTLLMPNPLALGRSRTARLFGKGAELREILDALDDQRAPAQEVQIERKEDKSDACAGKSQRTPKDRSGSQAGRG